MEKILSLLLLCNFVIFVACSDYPVFTEMANSRLRVIIKGTFESNNPRPWDLSNSSSLRDDSIDDLTTDSIEFPTQFMLDIAEMRLEGSGDADKFAFYRETYAIPLLDSEAFFDGTGVEFPCDDPYSHYQYTSVLVYIRKMIFDMATQWAFNYSTLSWEQQDDPQTIFREKKVTGVDFNQMQYLTYWDYLRTNYKDVLRIFPLRVYFPPGGFVFNRDYPETVLEIRFVIKNFMKFYEFDDTSSGIYKVLHFWALSDWLRDVRADDIVMGGNLIAVARSYVVGMTATISGSGGNVGDYIVAIEDGIDNIANYILTPPQRPDATGACYQPKPPIVLNMGDPYALLDYYIQFEKYRFELNSFITGCLEAGIYDDKWDEYEQKVGNFKIPPLVTYKSDSNYSITNAPVGKTYNIYRGTSPRGELPTTYTYLGTVRVNESDAGKTISGP
ncbi:MAG: hypothetical protein N2316_00880 [Spirochaetes bacterium]|nr:hypothetical protein [Spirochaetota bacterium]